MLYKLLLIIIDRSWNFRNRLAWKINKVCVIYDHVYIIWKLKKLKWPIFRNCYIQMNLMADVSILFADIAGFTKMSANKSAHELVGLLTDLFGRFDYLCGRCNLEKIGTLGWLHSLSFTTVFKIWNLFRRLLLLRCWMSRTSIRSRKMLCWDMFFSK